MDFAISNGDHSVVGVEAKASARARPSDFAGRRALREAAGASFRHGVSLYAGEDVAPFGDRLFAVPVSALWSWEAGWSFDWPGIRLFPPGIPGAVA